MLLAPRGGAPPREVAERPAGELDGLLGGDRRADRGRRPRLPQRASCPTAGTARRASPPARGRRRLGAGRRRGPERVLVEFVSANPTGPVTVGERARRRVRRRRSRALLALAGHPVEREYYLNDAGAQVRLFAESIAARHAGDEPPEDGYAGEYVAELGAELAAGGRRRRPRPARAAATEAMRVRIRGDPGALRRRLRHLVVRARAARVRRGRAGRSTACASAGTSTRARAPSGCARPSSATTRTAC